MRGLPSRAEEGKQEASQHSLFGGILYCTHRTSWRIWEQLQAVITLAGRPHTSSDPVLANSHESYKKNELRQERERGAAASAISLAHVARGEQR